jgi:hypothetical protein
MSSASFLIASAARCCSRGGGGEEGAAASALVAVSSGTSSTTSVKTIEGFLLEKRRIILLDVKSVVETFAAVPVLVPVLVE